MAKEMRVSHRRAQARANKKIASNSQKGADLNTQIAAGKRKVPTLLTEADYDAPLRGIAIARVSSKEQAEGYSIDAQKKIIAQYCHRKEIQVVRTYEIFESAGKKERRHFQAAIEFLIEHDLKVLAIEKTDRLTRNWRDMVVAEDLIEGHGVAIHFVKEGEVIDRNSNSHAKIMFGFKVLMAKSYLDNLSEEVKKGQQAKAERGHVPTVAPYGYRNNKETRLIEKDPKHAPIVQRIFKLYNTGRYSTREIAEKLNQSKHTQRQGRSFRPSMIHRILTNPVHYGDFMWKGQVYQGKHEPLVSYDLWKDCNDKLTGKNRNLWRTKPKFPFAGLLWNEFDRKWTGELHKGILYYSCSVPHSKKRFYMRSDAIVEKLCRFIEQIAWSTIFAQVVRDEAEDLLKEEREFFAANLKKIRAKIDDLRSQKQRLLDIYIAEEMERKDFLARRNVIDKELAKQKALIDRHEAGDRDFNTKIEDLVDVFCHNASDFRRMRSARKASFLRQVAGRVTLATSKEIELELHRPYDLFLTPEILAINKETPAALRPGCLELRGGRTGGELLHY